jgi:hypothetical protein
MRTVQTAVEVIGREKYINVIGSFFAVEEVFCRKRGDAVTQNQTVKLLGGSFCGREGSYDGR